MSSSTAGWKFNQVGIRVSDLEKSSFFYQAVLGMKEIVRLELDTHVILLLGYAISSEAGGDVIGMFNREGVLELIWNKNYQKPISNADSHPDFGFVKLCFTVPDLAACMARLKDFNVPVIKQPGEGEGVDAVARAIGVEPAAQGRNTALWQAVQGIGFVSDPDGYVIEMVQY